MNTFGKFFTNNVSNNANPQAMALKMIEQLKASGKITNEQYNSLMQSKDDPNAMANVMLQSRLINNDQYSQARNQVNSFFGAKH